MNPRRSLPGVTTRRGAWARASFTLTGLLVFPLMLLLFAQWPLRDWVQKYSREANDMGQIVFSIYVAVAVSAASRAGVHLSSSLELEGSAKPQRWRVWAVAACTVPWAAFMVWAGWPLAFQSAAALEHFSETRSPGYFIIKLAMILLVLLVLFESLWQLMAKRRQGPHP